MTTAAPRTARSASSAAASATPADPAPPPERRAATGRQPLALDRRQHAYRPDLADVELFGRVASLSYARAVTLCCTPPETPLLAAPDGKARQVSALLHGEIFRALEVGRDWSWGRCGVDGYVGYVATAALGPEPAQATHRVGPGDALLFAEPSIKARVLAVWPLNARVAVTGEAGDFVIAGGGFVHRRHLADGPFRDPVGVAEAFLGAPYRWGGRTRAGVDCSGLVQAALLACGTGAPRDSDQQAAALGQPVALADAGRGDLVFLPGHVGILVDAGTLLHANAHWMAVVAEPLADVLARQQAGVSVTVRRMRR